MPFLPEACSGICLGSILNLAFTVLTILQPCAPSTRITQHKKGQPPRQTLNNVRGYVFGQYGGLKNLQPDEEQLQAEVMAKLVNGAISCASFLSKGWQAVRGSGEG